MSCVVNKIKLICMIILKKLSVGLFIICLQSGCAQNAALLGPAYTLTTTGNMYQAGLTYGSNHLIEKKTGKSATQNLRSIIAPKKQKTDFVKLVNNRIKETRKKLNFSNQ